MRNRVVWLAMTLLVMAAATALVWRRATAPHPSQQAAQEASAASNPSGLPVSGIGRPAEKPVTGAWTRPSLASIGGSTASDHTGKGKATFQEAVASHALGQEATGHSLDKTPRLT